MAFEDAFSKAFNTSLVSSQQQLPRLLKMQRELAAEEQTANLNRSLSALSSELMSGVHQDSAAQAKDYAGGLEVLNSMSAYARLPDSSKSDKAAIEALESAGVSKVPRSLLNLLNAKGENSQGTIKLLDYLTAEVANGGQGKKFLLQQMENPTVINQTVAETMKVATSEPVPQVKEGLAFERMKLISMQKNRPRVIAAFDKLREHAAATWPNADTSSIDAAIEQYDAAIQNQRDIVSDFEKTPEEKARAEMAQIEEKSRLIGERFGPEAAKLSLEKGLDIEKKIPGSEFERLLETVTDPKERARLVEARRLNLAGLAEPAEKPAWDELGMVRTPNGDTVGVAFTNKRGDLAMRPINGGPLQPMPDNTEVETLGARNKEYISGSDYLKLQSELFEERQGIEQLTTFMSARENVREGLALLADQMSAQVKTIFGGKLSDSEFMARYATQNQEGLLGRMRVDVVGGGVMTEQDALRVIAAMGGPVSFLQNKEAAMAQLATVLDRKVKYYNMRVEPYNEFGKPFKGRQLDKIDTSKLGFDKYLERVPGRGAVSTQAEKPQAEKPQAEKPQAITPEEKQATIDAAAAAIRRGKSRAAVVKALEDAGIMDHGL